MGSSVTSFRSVSVVGLGKMGLGYDLDQGELMQTAKSHIGALQRFSNFEHINGVDRDFEHIPRSPTLASIRFVNFQSFSTSYNFDYDLLVLATPTNSHYTVLQTLIEVHRFKAAIIEKPCGLNPVECRQILDLLESNEVLWQVNYFRSELPNTLKALNVTHSMGLIPKRASIYGYGDVLNIFSHFIHLAIKFSSADTLKIRDCFSLGNQVIIVFESGFILDINNIGGLKMDLPILELDMDSHRLLFKNNGQLIELVEQNEGVASNSFTVRDFYNYQEYATKEYLKNLNMGISGDRRSVEKVHEIINAIISANDK
jgi:hypothetical protein